MKINRQHVTIIKVPLGPNTLTNNNNEQMANFFFFLQKRLLRSFHHALLMRVGLV